MRRKECDIDFKKLIQRDTGSFKKLYELYSTKLYNFLLAKTRGNEELAAEILNDTFYRAIESIDRLKNADNLQSWLFRIAYNKFIDHLRTMEKEEQKKYMTEKNAGEQSTLEDQYLEKEKLVYLSRALERLKHDYQQVLKMKYFDALSQKEIASIYKKKECAIEGMLFRARRALKKELLKDPDIFLENFDFHFEDNN